MRLPGGGSEAHRMWPREAVRLSVTGHACLRHNIPSAGAPDYAQRMERIEHIDASCVRVCVRVCVYVCVYVYTIT